MNKQEIISNLILKPDMVYNSDSFKQSADYRELVAEAEEELLAGIFNYNQNQLLDPKKLVTVLDQIEKWQDGKELSVSDKSIKDAAIINYMAIETMQFQAPESKNAVPAALLAYVNRSLDFDEAQSEIKSSPGFAVSLLGEGLKVIKSSMQGFTLQPAQVISTRFSSNESNKLPSKAVLQHQAENNQIQIELVNEGHQRLGVSFHLQDQITGQAILRLVEGVDLSETRILDSCTINNENVIHFSGIEAGTYVAELKPLNQKLAFIVQ